jgi:hypothetical protein
MDFHSYVHPAGQNGKKTVGLFQDSKRKMNLKFEPHSHPECTQGRHLIIYLRRRVDSFKKTCNPFPSGHLAEYSAMFKNSILSTIIQYFISYDSLIEGFITLETNHNGDHDLSFNRDCASACNLTTSKATFTLLTRSCFHLLTKRNFRFDC